MMNKMIAWWARNPVAANLLMIGILLSGVLAYGLMEREIQPNISINAVRINVAWPSAAPQEVEEQILIRIEEAISDMDNIEWVQSFASESIGVVFIRADPKIDMTPFVNDVKMRIDAIQSFPRDIEPPRITQQQFRQEMIRVAVSSDSLSERELKNLAEDFRIEMTQLPAISIVELFGVRKEEVSIELSENAMRRYSLTFAEVAQAIRNSSHNTSSGNVRTSTGDVQLRTPNLADTREDFEKIIVRQTGDGGLITVGDVADVDDGFEDREILATYNGKPAVLIQVMTTDVMDVVRSSESIHTWIEDVRTRLPEGVSVDIWNDWADVYRGRMETISKTAIYGLLLVYLVLLLTLRPKVAFWVTAGIGTAYAGALILLPGNDVSINMLSTFAFMLALGIVVDDAIVIGESIHEQGHHTGGGVDAAILGTQLVAKPVLYAVLTTMVAFLPWLFLSGEMVQFTRHITLVVVFSLMFSLVEAFLILPAHLANMKPRTDLSWFGRRQKAIADGIVTFARTRYRTAAEWAVHRRYLTTAIFTAVLVISIGFVSSGWVKMGFEPNPEDDQISINVELAEGTPYSRALEILTQMQNAEKALEEEVNARAKASGQDIRLIDAWYTRSQRESVLGLVKLAPPEVRDLSAKEAVERLQELMGEVPDAQDIQIRYSTNDSGPGLQFIVSHPELEVLRAATEDLKKKLRSFSNVYGIRDDLQTAADEIQLKLRPGAETLGITLADISRQVRQAYYGEEVQRLPRRGQDVKVMVRYPRESRRSLASLADFRVRTDDGRQIPLLSVVDIEFAPGLKQIRRWDGRRAAVIGAEINDDVRGDIMEDLDENFFPEWKKRYPGVSNEAIGNVSGQDTFFREVISLYAMAFFIMYALIAIAFRSYFLPLLVMTAIPFGFMGASYGHLALGVTMDIFSFFGIAAATGVVVNDNLVLVDYVNRLRDKGQDAYTAIVNAGVARFRPIVLTSLTTFVGLIPMMLEQSIQAQFLKPTVVSLAFGVAFATFVTLFMVPALYAVGEDVRAFSSEHWGRFKAYIRSLLHRQTAPVEAVIGTNESPGPEA